MKKAILIFTFIVLNISTFAQGLQWAKSGGGADYDQGRAVAVDASGNVYTTGYFFGKVDFDPGIASGDTFFLTTQNPNGSNAFILKLNASGSLIWAKNLGGIDFTDGYALSVDGSGSIYTTGYFSGRVDFDPDTAATDTFFITSAGPAENVFVSKLNSSGSFVWAKSFGGNDYADGYSITTDGSGNVYTTGYFAGTVDFNPDTAAAATYNLTSRGNGDAFISKLNSSGGFVWAKNIGSTGDDVGRSIAVDNSGNVYTTGSYFGTVDFNPDTAAGAVYNRTSTGNGDNIFILKLSSSGNFVWVKAMGGSDYADPLSIALDASANVYTTGYFTGTVDFNPDTTGGATFNITSTGLEDLFVSKLNSSGNFIFAKTMGGTSYLHGNSIAVDASANIYTTGFLIGTADFNPGTAPTDTFNLTAAANQSVFISKLNSGGNFVWASSLGGTDEGTGAAIAADNSGNAYYAGYFVGTIDFDPDTSATGIFNITPVGSADFFVSKVCSPPLPAGPISGSVSVCSGQSSTYSISPVSGATSYVWTIPSGTTINSGQGTASIQITFGSTSGDITVTPVNACSNGAMQSVSITVDLQPTVGFSVNPATAVCSGTGVTLSGNGASTYTWTGGITNGVSFTPSSTTNYVVTGTSVNGCTNTSNVTITVNQPPVVGYNISPFTTVCSGTSVNLSGTGASTYTWTGGISNGVSFTPVSTTTYTVTGTSGNGCTGSTSVIVTINPTPSAAGSITGASSLCSGASATYSISPVSGATSYAWTVPSGSTIVSGQNTTSINVLFGGTAGNIAVTPGNSCGNGNPATLSVTNNPGLAPTIGATASPSASVCAGSSVTLSGSGGVSYVWSGGITNAVSFVPVATTTYTVTGTGANGCSNSSSIAITVKLLPTVSSTISPSSTVCSGTSVTLSGSGASTYTWSGGITNGVPFAANSTTTYTVTGTTNGCSNTSTATVTVNLKPTVNYTVSPSSTICSGTAVTLSGTGASTYSWTGGVTNNVPFAAASTQTYTVTGTGANGCTSTSNATITVNLSPTVGATVSPSSTICSGASVTLSGTGASTYTWSGGVTNGVSFVPITTGSYTVTGTAANSCTSTNIVTVTLAPTPSAAGSIAGPSSLCSGSTATYSISPVLGATSYNWTVPVGTTIVSGQNTTTINIIYGTTSGNISVTPVNSCGNGTPSSITISINASLAPTVNVTTSPNTTVCAGTVVTLTGTGNALSYVWTGGISNGVAFLPGATATYTVVATGSNGCTNSTAVTVTVNPVPTVGSTVSPAASGCAGTSFTLSGTGASNYTLTGGVTNGIPFVPGSTATYAVTGTSSGCSATNTVTITILPRPSVSFTANPSLTVCAGTSVTLTGTGASTYSWTGGISNGVSFLPTGTNNYTVTGTGANGCTNSQTAIVIANQKPTVGSTVSPAALVCPNTSVTLNGTGASTYTWTGGVTNGVAFIPVTTTTYTVTGTNVNGCTNSNSTTVTVSPAPSAAGSITGPASICNGASASYSINPVAGATSYTWSVPPGASIVSGQNSTTLNILYGSSSGNITVTPVNSCGNGTASSLSVTINPNLAPTVGATAAPSTSVCAGTTVTLSGTGATTYSWTGGITNGFSFLPGATTSYTVTGTAANGCTNSATITVTVNPIPTVGQTAAPATNVCSSTPVTLNGTGATTYTWSGGVTNGVAFTPVSTTTYTVTGTSNGCSNTSTVTISVNARPNLSINVSPSSTVCSGTSVTLTGSGASTYSWSGGINNGVSFVPTISRTDTLVGTAANGCTASLTTSITVNQTPTVGSTISPSSTVCPGTVVSLSGTGAASYTWSGGVTNGISFIPVSTTTYSVTGTAVNGCTSTSTAIVTVSTPLSATGSITGPSSLCDGASATYSISPVTGATQYSWTIPGGTTLVSGQNTPSITIIYGSASGNITVTPGNSCGTGTQASTTVTVNPNLAPVVGYTATPNTSVCAGAAVTLSGTGAQTYTWSGGISNTVSFVPDSTRSYTVTGTGANGCTNSSNVTITVNPIPTVGITVLPSTTLCEGDSLNLSGTGAFTYTWTGGVIDGTSFVPISDNTYIVTGEAGGCTNSDTVSITLKLRPIVGYLVSPFSTVCPNTPITLSGTGASFYTWSGGIMDGVSFQPTTNNTYTVTGTDTSGCSNTNFVNVVVYPLPVITLQPINQTATAGTTVTFMTTSSAPGATYQWQVDSVSGFVDLANTGPYSGVNSNTLSISNVNMSQNNYHFRCVITDGNCSDTTSSALLLIQVGLVDVSSNISYYVYPNPAYDLINIQTNAFVANTTYKLLDAAGKYVLIGTLNSGTTTIDIRKLAAGFYFLQVGEAAKAPIAIIKQ